MRVAVVMAAYNGEKYISEQIDSILSSPNCDTELYIYDDGSTDRTVSILKNYETRFPDTIHINQNPKNLGVTRNFLQGICNTTTDYVMLCDQDDVWKPDKIGITLKRMRQLEVTLGKETPLAVFTDAEIVNKELTKIHNSFFQSSHLNPGKTDLPHLLMENKLIGCTVMINAALRNILKSYPLPDKARFHDWWVALIAASLGKISYINECTMLYRQHGNNVVGNSSFISYMKNRVSSLKKQKEALISLQYQAEEFYHIYQSILPESTKTTILRFALLSRTNIVKRKYRILRYHYLKTGFVRNFGLMIII